MEFSMSSKIFDFWDPTTKSSGEKEQTITRSSDCAVIIKDSNKSLETEKSLEAEISSFSSNILDVVPFFRLPLYIQFEVFKYGKTLFVRDEEYLMQVKRDVLREYLDISYLYERMSRRILAR
ncbi:MAG: hypothetical protein MASP_01760 [Candidatus Methanolliviera sp. GoM_asphalt]|nr:MAG: hypothetical protein MASP_01760 [Candidatus Methanolliviera sp. GoM_asphalt]